MNLNTQVALTESEEIAVKAAAENLVRSAALKSGKTFEEIPIEARTDAINYARTSYIEEKALKQNPLWPQLESERAAHALTKKTLEASQQVRPSPVSGSRDTGPDPDVVRARMGETNWWGLTDNGRLQVCGVNPDTLTQVDLTEAKRCFGKSTDTHYASNLAKQDWGRYKHLKRIANVLDLLGK